MGLIVGAFTPVGVKTVDWVYIAPTTTSARQKQVSPLVSVV